MRLTLAQLAGLAFGSSVEVWGRITHVRERDAQLADESGEARLLCDEPPPTLGSLVRLCAEWSAPGVLTAPRFEAIQPPAQPFSYTGSEIAATRARATRLRQRAQVLRELRDFFDGRGFLEVETPLVVPSPGLDLHLDAVRVATGGSERYLITSPEYQMKRLLAGGLERIYQLCKCFRNDERGERHQPEFSMLEWYRGFAGVEQVMRDTEQLVAELARWVSQRLYPHDPIAGRAVLRTAWGDVDVTPPWPRITMREAFARFCPLSMDDALRDEEQFYRLLVDAVEPGLAQLGAVFLCEWPAGMASLARKKPDDASVAERFEAYIAGLELCNGFGELTDVHEQRARLLADQAARAAQGLPVYPLDERFLAALAEGMPESAGNALGVDRLLMLLLGAREIEDVIAVGASRL